MELAGRPVAETTAAASIDSALRYMPGSGNQFETEALPGALPIGRNFPQRCPYGLYAEQLSGSPFTAPRQTNGRSWLYRIRPTVKHRGRFRRTDARQWRTAPCTETPPAPARWNPLPLEPTSFVEGIITIPCTSDAAAQAGMATHIFTVLTAAASHVMLIPRKLEGTMAFMFESRHIQRVTWLAAEMAAFQQDYVDCWAPIPKLFDATRREPLA